MYSCTGTLPLPGEGAKLRAGSITGQCQPFSVAGSCDMASRTFCLPPLAHEEFVLHFVHNYRSSMSIVLISYRFYGPTMSYDTKKKLNCIGYCHIFSKAVEMLLLL